MLDILAAAVLFTLLWLQSLGNPLPQTPLIFTGVWALGFLASLAFGTLSPKTPPAPRRPTAIACGLAGLSILLTTFLLLYPSAAASTWLPMWGTGALLCTLGATFWRPAPEWPGQAIARLGVGMALGTLLLWIPPEGGEYQRLALFPAQSALLKPVMLAVALTFLGIWTVGCGEKKRWSVWACVGVLLALRIWGMHGWDIDPAVRDMTALIDSATDAMLAGKNPYRIHQMQQGSEVPLTYLPGLWGAHLVPKLLGLDVRWGGVAAEAALVAGVWWGTRGSSWEGRALGFLALWAVLPSVQWNLIYAEPMVWWALMVWGLATLVRGKTLASAVFLGLMLCTRHFAVLLLPFFCITWFRQLGPRQAAEALGVTGGVCAVGLGPFVLWDPEMFWFGTLRWLRAYGPVHHTWFYDKFSLAKPLYTSGWIRWAPLAQLAMVVAGSLVYFRSQRQGALPKRLWIAALVWLGFVMLNGLVWYSFFLGTLLCALMTTTPATPLQPVAPTRWRPLLLALALGCGALIGTTLLTHGSQPDRSVLLPILQKAPPAALFLDQSQRELAFVGTEKLPLAGPRTTPWQALSHPEGTQAWQIRDMRLAPSSERPNLSDVLPGTLQADIPPWKITSHTLPRTVRLSERLSQDSFSPRYIDPSSTPTRTTPLLPRSPTLFHASPTYEAWARVERQGCQIPGAPAAMLFAHPLEARVLQLHWSRLPLGKRLVLFGGIESPAVRWGRADVTLKATLKLPQGERTVRETVTLENRPGLRGLVMDTAEFEGKEADLEMELTTKEAAQRWVCLDGVVVF